MPTLTEHEASALAAFQGNVATLAQKELDRLEVERVELETALGSVRVALRSVKATLAASQPKEPKAKKAKASTNGGFAPSEERQTAFEMWLAKLDESTEITSALLKAAFPDWADSYGNMVMKWAREHGYLRKAGQSGSTIIYRRLG